MEAGRELDKLVAQKVFGLGQHPIPNECSQAEYERIRALNGNELRSCPEYSFDIASAWPVWEKITSGSDKWLYDSLWRNPHTGKWNCGSVDRDGCFCSMQEAETAPMAICLAALEIYGRV